MCPHDDILKGKQNVTQTDIQDVSITLADLERMTDIGFSFTQLKYFSIRKDCFRYTRQSCTLYQAVIFKFLLGGGGGGGLRKNYKGEGKIFVFF